MGAFTDGVDLTRFPWLHHDWNQSGDFSDTSLPDATFSLGNYRAIG